MKVSYFLNRPRIATVSWKWINCNSHLYPLGRKDCDKCLWEEKIFCLLRNLNISSPKFFRYGPRNHPLKYGASLWKYDHFNLHQLARKCIYLEVILFLRQLIKRDSLFIICIWMNGHVSPPRKSFLAFGPDLIGTLFARRGAPFERAPSRIGPINHPPPLLLLRKLIII